MARVNRTKLSSNDARLLLYRNEGTYCTSSHLQRVTAAMMSTSPPSSTSVQTSRVDQSTGHDAFLWMLMLHLSFLVTQLVDFRFQHRISKQLSARQLLRAISQAASTDMSTFDAGRSTSPSRCP